MNTLKPQYPAWRQVSTGRAARMRTLVGLAFCGIALLAHAPEAQAQTYSVNQASALCRQFTNSVRNLRELSDRRDVLIAVKTCIDLGIDPPLKARNQYGRAPASGVATAQIPGHTCPPFATCLFGARVNTAASAPLSLGGTEGAQNINASPVNSVYNAPQFNGHLPNEIPEHLENGGTIYFYGDNIDINAPADSLLYPDSGANFYADGGTEEISDGHVMVPPAPNGVIMDQQPVVPRQQVLFNFDDGGIMVLPPGFSGVINGRQVQGGDIIVINHSDDILIPAGTKLYPFPMGSHPAGEHVGDHNHAPYTGPPVTVPPADATSTNNDDPGTAVWWTGG